MTFVERVSVKDNLGESGGVILLFAVICTVLIGFAALSIDLYRAASTRDQIVSFTRMASLGALEQYYKTSDYDSGKQKDLVSKRVKSVLEKQFKEGSPLQKRLNPDGTLKDGVNIVLQAYSPDYEPLETFDADDIVVSPGNYLYSRNQYEAVYKNASKPDECKTYPCFLPSTSGDPVTSAEVFAQFPDFGYSGFINALAGDAFERLSLRSTAVATIVPRIGCFLVDVSPSVARETHPMKPVGLEVIDPDGYNTIDQSNNAEQTIPGPVLPGFGRRPAFVLSSNNPSSSFTSTADDPNCEDIDKSVIGKGNYGDYQEKLNNEFEYGYASALACRYDNRGDDERVGYNYWDDFRVRQTVGDRVYSSFDPDLHPNPAEYPAFSMGDTGLFFNVQINGGTGYRGPEPFMTIMDGLAFAVERFKERNVPGDKLCLIFYDQELSWARTIKPTDDFDYLLKLVKDDGLREQFSDSQASVQASTGHVGSIVPLAETNWMNRIIRHGIFPGYMENLDDSSGGQLQTNYSSNLPNAVMAASNLIYEEISDRPASAFMAVFGDGLTNCEFDGDCSDGVGCYCSNELESHQSSIKSLYSLAEDALIGREIPMHLFLIGKAVNPHIVYHYEDGTGRCLEEAEVRALDTNSNFVEGNAPAELQTAWDNKDNPAVTDEGRWYETTRYLYNMAKLTGGIWAPIMESGGGNCKTYEEVCEDMAGRPPHRSRRTVDPNCESKQLQIERYIDQIIGDNPFVISESR